MSAIRTADLSKSYGNVVALDRLDLVVEPGEVYGYLGPNGAGKTRTIRLLLGLHRPTSGRAELFGMDAWRDPVDAHRRVAYVAGEPFLWPQLTTAETFELLARLHGSSDAAYCNLLVERFQLDIDPWAGAASQGADVSLGAMLEAGLNCLPISLLFLSLASLAYGLLPRASTGIAYGLVSVAFVWQLFGSLLGAPHWVVDLSPFQHIGLVPAQPFHATAAIVVVALAAVSALASMWAFRRRDLTAA